ncbi:hypothetical protein BDP27DRAFT_1327557 [Rhodocollybia butyracea]|uniref:Uncharacterized protein n=1 Tax=Rhodocollybia butyracea TaxID=206335 RepID=A0A9P5U7S5_9AGAR|nr:hypothetical protein BDP27DRAFT_1327557 [Rhodocollybia butyracea]
MPTFIFILIHLIPLIRVQWSSHITNESALSEAELAQYGDHFTRGTFTRMFGDGNVVRESTKVENKAIYQNIW